jgi:Zn-dependent protease with chaperone function
MATVPTAILPPLVRREQRHRRRVLLALAGLLVLSISPVVGHHLIGAVSWLPASQQHLGVLCLVALHHLLAPVHTVFHLLLYAGVAYAVLDRVRAARRHAVVMRALTVEPTLLDSTFFAAVTRAGLDPARVRVVQGLPNPAFTTGWWHPRVFVARDLPQRLSPDELVAVLAHEAEHVRRRDPLRLFLLRSLAGVLFWLPAIRRLVADLADEAEIAADDAAARTHALPLASAILRMAGADLGSPDPAVGFQRTDLLARRIRRLAGEDAFVGTHVSHRSISAAVAALLAVWISGVMVLHPLPTPDDPAAPPPHCTHPGAWSVTHLFCRGFRVGHLPADCPHSARPVSTPTA